ncbi:hypothetical protein ACJJTC_006728 [Scirpophaga incertulas]
MGHWVTAASSVLAFLLYYNTLDAGFVYDDRRAILSNPDVIGHTPFEALFGNDFWGTPLSDPGSHGSYRPLCVATYRFNYAFSGFKPWSYHLLNVVLHCTATILVVIVAKRLLPHCCARVGTIVAGLIFAAHPIHTEAVAGIVGRADLAACNLFLLSFLVYSEHIKIREQQYKLSRKLGKNIAPKRKQETNDHSFRLSCHDLVHHIMMNFRRLLKASRAGPMKVLHSCELKTDLTKKLKCKSDSVSEETSEFVKWLTLSGTLLFATAGTLCKEPAIMVLPLCIFYDFIKTTRHEDPYSKGRWRSICALGTGGFVLLYWRLRIAGTPTAFASADNPASRDPSILTRFYTFSYLPVFNFLLLIYPFNLSFDWSMESIPRITTILDSRNLLTFIFYAILYKVTLRAFKLELKKRHDKSLKESKYNKKQICKLRNKWTYSKYRAHDERKKYHLSHKDNGYLKKSCECAGCQHPLTEEHTVACRAMNNNNAVIYSNCVCTVASTKLKTPMPQKNVYLSLQAALLVTMAFMVLPFVPATNILFYVGFVVAERVLYIPSVGFCLLLGLGAGIMTRDWHRSEMRSKAFMLTLLVILASMSGYTIRRNIVWRNEESLFRSALHINPPKAYGNLGSVLSSQGRTAEAEIAFERALKYRPNMADVHYNLGILRQNQRRFGEAIKSFERAIYFRPSMALAYVNLGTSLMADGRLAEAASALRAGSRAEGAKVRDRREHDAAKVSALVQLAALHSQRGHWHKALSAYKEALQILPDSGATNTGWKRHNVLSMAGEIYVQLQQWPQAEHTILSALAIAPDHVGAHLTLAQILARNVMIVSEGPGRLFPPLATQSYQRLKPSTAARN